MDDYFVEIAGIGAGFPSAGQNTDCAVFLKKPRKVVLLARWKRRFDVLRGAIYPRLEDVVVSPERHIHGEAIRLDLWIEVEAEPVKYVEVPSGVLLMQPVGLDRYPVRIGVGRYGPARRGRFDDNRSLICQVRWRLASDILGGFSHFPISIVPTVERTSRCRVIRRVKDSAIGEAGDDRRLNLRLSGGTKAGEQGQGPYHAAYQLLPTLARGLEKKGRKAADCSAWLRMPVFMHRPHFPDLVLNHRDSLPTFTANAR
ncbi:hypothetical protein [Chelativorans xinjiangense]|uniref:hypothetical protein n=1 Tax=Chelativorans xinjiangense TaxID=2681485 RepID=UPI0013574135|nr:hypothetical protein [Chelativorans xinjiangense]